MAAIDLPYTYLAKGRYWRFRRAGRDTKINGEPGSPEFMAHYQALMDAEDSLAARKPPAPGSFNWLIAKYERSAEFRALAQRTQDDYARTLELLREELGDQPFAYTTRRMIKAVRDDYADTPRKAHKIKQMVSRLYSWAEEDELVPEGMNPAAKIRKLNRQGGEREIAVWSDEEVALFLEHCPARIKTPVLIALYTGQRKEDVLTMTWSQVQGGTIRVRQSKTRAMLDLGCHPELRRHLESLPREGVQICIRETATEASDDRAAQPAKPWNSNAFGAALYRAVRATPGMPTGRSLHGLRYAAASRMEEAGATVAEIEAVLGHRTFRMALKYATQRLRAKAGIERLTA